MTQFRFVILIFSLFFIQVVYSQTISKKDFVNTEWFTDNKNDSFHESDTIKIIKYSNIHDSGNGFNIYFESEGLGDSESVKFQFNRYGNMHLWKIYYHSGTKSRNKERKWKIDRKTNDLLILRDNKIEYRLKPIDIREIEFTVKNESFKTMEITMFRK